MGDRTGRSRPAAAARRSARASPPTRHTSAELLPHLLRVFAYAVVAVSILSLPLLGTGGAALPTRAVTPGDASEANDRVFALSIDQEPRVAPLARARDVLAQQRSPVTVTSNGPAELNEYDVQDGDNLIVIAAHFGVSPETVAYNNHVTDARLIHVGDHYRIPPMDGAIYKVKDGDTIDQVAAFFKVDAKSVMDTNRLYFEPENFAAGKEILVPSATFPNFELKDAPRWAPPSSMPLAQPLPAPTGRLWWPVRGIISQYFWYGHQGVDIAAPYGSGIAASDDGTVSAVGWVAVGGLRVCLTHDWSMVTCYYHTSATYVTVGQRVARGQIIAAIGMTGVTTGPHVHWEARYHGVLVNALAY